MNARLTEVNAKLTEVVVVLILAGWASLAVADEQAQSGETALSVGVVGDDLKPVVRLGITGRDKDGWYSLSQLEVK